MKNFLLLLIFLLQAIMAISQNRVITGKVSDENGAPFPGATVTIKETGEGKAADNAGNYSISIDGRARTLVFSHTGMTRLEIPIGNESVINVVLNSEAQALSDLVVIAYGTSTKKKLTGSQVKLSGDQFANVPQTSVDIMLQGKAAGLQAVATSGQPGALNQIRIRGIGSINASSNPLFVIDGIPVNSGDASRLIPTSNLLAGLNPNDIEDLTVLKDAAATSIYGSRAANGVILITTKRGKSGKLKFNVDAEIGLNDIAYFPELATPLTLEELKNLTIEGLRNVGASQASIDNILNQYGYNSTANYNWLDLVSRQGQQQQANFSASGGSNGNTLFISAGYFRQQSPVIGSDFKRYSSAFNGTLKATDKLIFSVGANFSSFDQIGESEGSAFRNPVFTALALRPSQEAYKPDGSPEYDRTIYEQIFNPLAIAAYDRRKNNTSKLLANIGFDYSIIKDLVLKVKYGVDFSNIEESSYRNPFFGDSRTTQGSFFSSYRRLFNWILVSTVEYKRRFIDNRLDGSILAGHESQENKDRIIASSGTGVPLTTSITYPAVSTPTGTIPLSSSENAIESYFSRVSLSFDNKYNLSISLRRDGASRFAPDERWGTFWSVGASWNIDQENFMNNIKFVSSAKLRGSVGTSGNNGGIGNYDWRPTYTFSGNYTGQPASFPNNVGNPLLTWEKNKSYDIGLEVGLIKNRITFELSYYSRETFDLLLNQPLSGTTGFTSFSNNIGSMENRGVEINANSTLVQIKDFTWTIGLNAAWNKNKILSLSNTGADIVQLPYIRRVGEDYQSIYTRLWAGADPATGNPLWYIDQTKSATTSTVSLVQRAIIGSASPKGFGGITNSVRYKNFSITGQLNFQYGNLINDQWSFIYTSDGAFPNLNKNRKQLRRWRNPGDITDVPRYDFNNATVSNAASSRYFNKGDFVRLRYIMFSYEFPQSILNKAKLSGLTFYVRGTNLWTKVFDEDLVVEPEQPINGAANNQFFIPKSFTAGINLSF